MKRVLSSAVTSLIRPAAGRAVSKAVSPSVFVQKQSNVRMFSTAAAAVNSSTSTSSNKKNANTPRTCGIGFALEDQKGELMRALKVFDKHDITLTRIENRPSPLNINEQMFFVHFVGNWEEPRVVTALKEIDDMSKGRVFKLRTPSVPWFPRCMSDIDQFSKSTLDAGTDLASDHPGFKDQEYRRRREAIVEKASSYRAGQKIPEIEYSDDENKTWGVVYDQLTQLYPNHACDEFLEAFASLESAGIFSRDKIPQLQHVSEYLQSKTGFTLRPVTGLLSGRDFLNALAFRTFFSTQYIRHHSVPLYTPEPDVIHELMGHAPMLANPDFADFSQIIGLASLGATDEQVKKLASCYWFSVEFGLLFQNGGLKAYGAGILSSFGELQFSTSPTNTKAEVRPWDPAVASVTEYPITTYQPIYYAATSLQEAKERMLEYCQSIQKPFSIRFDKQQGRIVTDVDVVAKPVGLKF